MSDNALSALRALQAATGEAGAAGASNLPAIPAVPATDDAALANWMSSVKAWLEAANAAGATGFATKEDLIRAGVLQQDEQGNVAPTVPASAAVPPAPSGLTAAGAVESIIVSWNNPLASYGNHAYAEVWAAGDANFTNAVMVGQAAGFMFAHVTGDAAQRWYWVRFVSTSGVKGPFSAVNGVPGASAAVDPAAIFDAIEGSALAANPFFTITPAMVTAGTNVVNGIALPAGTYIKEAFVAAATISRAMIRDAAIDNAKIANLDAVKINAGIINADRIGARTITAEKIATSSLTANEIAAGTITADKMAANSITAANGAIADLSVSTLKIQGQAVTVPTSSFTNANGMLISGAGFGAIGSVAYGSTVIIGPVTLDLTSVPAALSPVPVLLHIGGQPRSGGVGDGYTIGSAARLYFGLANQGGFLEFVLQVNGVDVVTLSRANGVSQLSSGLWTAFISSLASLTLSNTVHTIQVIARWSNVQVTAQSNLSVSYPGLIALTTKR